MNDGRVSTALVPRGSAAAAAAAPASDRRQQQGLHHQAHAVKSTEGVSAVSMLQNSMAALQRMEDLHLDEEVDDDLEPARVTALVAESLGLEPQSSAEVTALMRESLAVAERLAAASLMTSVAARRRLQARSIELSAGCAAGLCGDLEEYVPPRALLLYLVR
ncbi:hypothetical protein ONE63_009834 [Megalurothrips usitatus]|uniref:Uncharacterized protein n=1 Tax=Megalurothrips usitatus TaxID=439358 RepID=A0AAV7XGY6_9NEOP|nr:hypothetical protein ONE63_009834 [Megalurothrips usitatus]